jgi:oligoendopeptidase F
MNMRWSLDELYTSFESEELKRDMEKCTSSIEGIKAWAEANLNSTEDAARKIEEFLNMEIEFDNLISRVMSFASLTSSTEEDMKRHYS